MIDLNTLSERAYSTAKIRVSHDPQHLSVETIHLLKHAASEIVEATEAFTTWRDSAIDDPVHQKEKFTEELSDVIMCCLIAASGNNINIEQALKSTLAKNLKRASLRGDKA